MKVKYTNDGRLRIPCPGCRAARTVANHVIPLGPPSGWSFNGDVDNPTLSPSVLTKSKRWPTDDECTRILAGENLELPTITCHLFVRAGQIEYLTDCTHPLAGKMVTMEEIE